MDFRIKPTLFLQQLLEAHRKPWLRNCRERVAPHIPPFQTRNDHRTCRKVDHRAGAKGRDELAKSLRIFCHVRSSAFAIVFPCGSLTFRATLDSTSLIERPATNLRWGSSRLAQSGSKGICRSRWGLFFLA